MLFANCFVAYIINQQTSQGIMDGSYYFSRSHEK